MAQETWEQDIRNCHADLASLIKGEKHSLNYSLFSLPDFPTRVEDIRIGMKASSSADVSSDIKDYLRDLNKDNCNMQKTCVSKFSKHVTEYNKSSHSDEDWKKDIKDQTDQNKKEVDDGLDKNAQKAIDKIDTLSTSDEKTAAKNYYIGGLKYAGNLIQTFLYEFNRVLCSIVDIINNVIKTIETVGETIAAAIVGIINQIIAL